MNNVVMVFGVPGVGKSSIISAICSKPGQQNLVPFSVSQFILQSLRTTLPHDYLRSLPADEILGFQDQIAAGIVEIASKSRDKVVLVDGHSVIDRDDRLLPVPVSIIEIIDPICMTFLKDDPERIRARRDRDRSRSRAERSVSSISREQDFALMTCETYAETLHLSLTIIDSNHERGLSTVVDRILMQIDQY